jgi:hypothetical protein
MCLDRVDQRFPVPDERPSATYVRWKAFAHLEQRAYLMFKEFEWSNSIPRGQWLTAENCLVSGGNDSYVTGWHVYSGPTAHRPVTYSEIEVLVSGLIAVGVQEQRSVEIYQYLYVPKPGEDKKETKKCTN